MTQHYNNLSPAQAERLAMLIEEAGEVIQAATKILRHGYEGSYDNGIVNRGQLHIELGDFLGIMDHMIDYKDINEDVITGWRKGKIPRAIRHMHHFEGVGDV